MSDAGALRQALSGLEGKGYGAYKRLRDSRWDLEGMDLTVERVASDPYAPPSRLRLTVPASLTVVPEAWRSTPTRRRALADYLGRRLADALDGHDTPFRVDAGGQQVLARRSCTVDADGTVVARFGVELPARGRRIAGEAAAHALCSQLPAGAAAALVADRLDVDATWRHIAAVEDAVTARGALGERGLVAFLADGAILPRRSGVDDRPLDAPGVVPLRAPEELRVELDLPNAGRVAGLGIPEGVTLLVGGGFHGKSTLLRAIADGVYDHVPGDGRELAVSRADAMAVRAEDGRAVTRVDISAFVGALPNDADTADFTTAYASGSTSQAAAIVEAVEAGAGVLLVDEDTSATNLMVRDARMQALIADDREPLTPFVDVVRSLHRDHDVSTVLVVGGVGDYLDVADTVVWMDAFTPREVTARARSVAADHPGRAPAARRFADVRDRSVDPASVEVRRGGKVKTRAHGTRAIRLGHDEIDLSAVSGLVDASQTAGVAQVLVRLAQGDLVADPAPLVDVLDAVDDMLDDGLDALAAGYPGDLAEPRALEVAAALNRLRSLRITGLG